MFTQVPVQCRDGHSTNGRNCAGQVVEHMTPVPISAFFSPDRARLES